MAEHNGDKLLRGLLAYFFCLNLKEDQFILLDKYMINKDKIKRLLLASTAMALLGSASMAMADDYTADTAGAGANTVNIDTASHWQNATGANAAPTDKSNLLFGNAANDAITLIIGKNFNINNIDIASRNNSIIRLDNANTQVSIFGNLTATAGHAGITLNGANQTLTLQGTIDAVDAITFAANNSTVVFNGTAAYAGKFTANGAANSSIAINKAFNFTGDSGFANISIVANKEKFTHTFKAANNTANGNNQLSNVTIASGAEYEAAANDDTAVLNIIDGGSITGAGTFTFNANGKDNTGINVTTAVNAGTIGTSASRLDTLQINNTTAAVATTINPKVFANNIVTKATGNVHTVNFTKAVDATTLNLSNNAVASTYNFADSSTVGSINFGSNADGDIVKVAANKVLTLGSVSSNDNKHGVIVLGDQATLAGDIITNGTFGFINKIQTNIAVNNTVELKGNHTQVEFTNATAGTLSLGKDTVVSALQPGAALVVGTVYRPAITTTTNKQGTAKLSDNATVIGDIGITGTNTLKEVQIAAGADALLQPLAGIFAGGVVFQGDANLTVDTDQAINAVAWSVQSTNLNGKNVTIKIKGKQNLDFTKAGTVQEQFVTKDNATANANITVSLAADKTAILGRLGKSGGSAVAFNSLDIVSGIAAIKADSNVKTITLGEQGVVRIDGHFDTALVTQPVTLNVTSSKAGTGGVVFAAEKAVLGKESVVGSATNGLGVFTLENSADATKNVAITLNEGAEVYANAITAGQNKSTITLSKGDYDFEDVAIALDNPNLPSAALSELTFTNGTGKVSIGSARITTITTTKGSTLELTGDSYDVGIKNTAADDNATVIFNNSKDIAKLYARIGDATGTSNGPVGTLVIAGKNVKFADTAAAASTLNATKIQFTADSVLTLPVSFTGNLGKVEVAKNNIGTIEAVNDLTIDQKQDAALSLKEVRISGQKAVTVNKDIDTYNKFTTAKDGVADITINGAGKVVGDIGSSSQAFKTVTVGADADRTFSGSVFARSFTLNGEASFQAAQSAESSLTAQTVTLTENSILTVENNSSINGAIKASADGFGALTFHGAGKDVISGIGAKGVRIGEVNIAKNGDTATSRSVAGDVYAVSFNVTDAEVKLSQNSTITAEKATLSNTTISADKYTANLKGSNMKLSGTLTLNSDLSNSKVLVIDAGTIDYSGLNAISADYLGSSQNLPKNDQTFNLVSFAEGTKLDAATQDAIYKLVNVGTTKTNRYVQYVKGDKGVITAKVDFSKYSSDIAGASSQAVAEQLTELGKAATATNSALLPAISYAEASADKVGASIPIVAALAPSTTGNLISATAAATALGAIDSLTGSLDTSNGAVVASGEYDDIRFGVVGQAMYGKSSADTTETYRGHDAVNKGLLGGVQVSTGNVNGSIVGIYSPTELTYKTKLNYGTAIDNKAVSISDAIKTDTVTANSIGGVANVVYGLQGGVYANATIGYLSTNVKDNTVRLNDLTDGQKVTSESTITSYIGRAAVGYAVGISEDFSLTPVLGLNVLNQNDGGYTEQGTGPAKLEVKEGSFTNVSGLVGAKLNGSVALEDDMKVSGELRGNVLLPISSSKHTKSVALVGSSAVDVPVTYASDSISYNVGGQLTASKDIFNVTLGADLSLGKNTNTWAGFVRVGIDM